MAVGVSKPPVITPASLQKFSNVYNIIYTSFI